MIVGLLLQRRECTNVDAYQRPVCTAYNVGLRLNISRRGTMHVRYTRVERGKKGESEEEMEEGRRIDRDASKVLRRNSVIIRGGRDRPGKIIFR